MNINTRIKVTLILADWVRDELEHLDRAENDRDCPSKSLAISAAMKGIREALNVQLRDDPTVEELTDSELSICKQLFRYVGDNTFVFEPEQIVCFKQALKLSRSK